MMMVENNIKKLAIVIPVANESETLDRFYSEIKNNISSYEQHLKIEILFVVDYKSVDNTREIVESLEQHDSRVKLIWSPENESVAGAYLAGFNAAINNNCDFILEMDAGFSHLPAEIPSFIDKLTDGYDCVFSWRFGKRYKAQMSHKRVFYSRAGTCLANFLLGTKYRDMTSGFEAFRADTLKKIISKKLVSTGHFFQTEIRFRARNFNYCEVPINYTNTSSTVPLKSIVNAIWGLLVCFISRFNKIK